MELSTDYSTLWYETVLRILSGIVSEDGKGFEIMDYAYFQRGNFIVVTHHRTNEFSVGEENKSVVHYTCKC